MADFADWIKVADYKWTLTVDGIVYIIRKASPEYDDWFLLNAELENPPEGIPTMSLTQLLEYHGTLDNAKKVAFDMLTNALEESQKNIDDSINKFMDRVNKMIDAAKQEKPEESEELPERFSDWVKRERAKDPENICDPPIEYNVAVSYLIKYLIEDGWYVAMPESAKQITTACVWHILEEYSPRFRKELEEKRRISRMQDKFEYKTRVLKRRYNRKMERQKEPNPFKRFRMFIEDTINP